MNDGMDELNRTPSDFIQFAVIFIGFVLAVAGMITSSIRGALVGVILMVIGLAYFFFRRSDAD